MGCGDVTVLEAGAVCVCDVSPLGHSLTPVFLQVRSRGVLLSGRLRPS